MIISKISQSKTSVFEKSQILIRGLHLIKDTVIFTLDNTDESTKKDGYAPSFLLTHLYSENLIGSSKKISLYNSARDKQFAWFDGKVYMPRHPKKNQLLSRKERLWQFMTVRTAIDKQKMSHLEFVKHSSM